MTEPHDIGRLFEDGAAIDAALAAAAQLAVREALLRGRPVVVWQDGQVVELPADQIPPLDSALNLETRSITT